MLIKIAGSIQEMAAEEILDHVPASTYKRIKAKDANPEFRAYVIGHEGESTGKVVGMGRVVKRWVRAAVERINEKLTLGTQFFHLHGATNDHTGRKPIAEVAGKTLSDIAGRLSSIAIAYIYPAYRDIPLDVASIEADITMPESISPNARSVDVDVESITGIALGNSEIATPGFAGATLLATVQEFADANHEKTPKEGEKPMTKSELIAAIREAKLTLSDLFSPREIADDSSVQEVIRDKRRNEEGFEGRRSEKLEAEKAKLEQEKKDLQTKLDTYGKSLLRTKAADSLKSAVEKRKLDDKQAAFVAKNAAKFEPHSEDTLAGDLDKFIDSQLEDLKAFAEVYGIKPDAGPVKTGLPAGKTPAGDADLDALLTPDSLKDAPAK